MSDETKVGRIAFGPSDPNREGQCRAFGDHAAAPDLGSGIATGSTSFILETAQLRAEVAALTAEILALKAILEEVQYMSVGCDCTDCYSLRMRLAERAANLLGLRATLSVTEANT